MQHVEGTRTEAPDVDRDARESRVGHRRAKIGEPLRTHPRCECLLRKLNAREIIVTSWGKKGVYEAAATNRPRARIARAASVR